MAKIGQRRVYVQGSGGERGWLEPGQDVPAWADGRVHPSRLAGDGGGNAPPAPDPGDPPPETGLEDLTKAEIRAYADARGYDLTGVPDRHDELVAAVAAADAAPPPE